MWKSTFFWRNFTKNNFLKLALEMFRIKFPILWQQQQQKIRSIFSVYNVSLICHGIWQLNRVLRRSSTYLPAKVLISHIERRYEQITFHCFSFWGFTMFSKRCNCSKQLLFFTYSLSLSAINPLSYWIKNHIKNQIYSTMIICK